ncbi:MAG: MerR family transcriptional regulator [Lysobacter sp.]
MSEMTIAGLAREGGVGVETVRYYQRRGLLDIPRKPAGPEATIRRYGEADVKRLRFIRSAQTAGFTLEEIGELIELDASEDRSRAKQLAKTRINALDTRIRELEVARDALRRLADRCGSGTSGPCPILTAFQEE